MDGPAGQADEVHGRQHGALAAIFKVGPYTAFGLGSIVEGVRVGVVYGPARDGGDEAGAEEDGEDAEILGCVGNDDLGVVCTKCVLYMRAKLMRQHHHE